MFTGKYENTINSISQVIKFCFQLCIFFGAVITIFYCGYIDYYPTGLTLGDTLFFIVASLAFAFVYTLIFLVLLSTGITISPFLRWVQPLIIWMITIVFKLKKRNVIIKKIDFPLVSGSYSIFALIGVIFLFLISSMIAKDPYKAFTMFFSSLGMGMLFGMLHTKPRLKVYREGWAKKVKLGIFLLAYLVPLLMIEARGSFLNQSMQLIGVRSEQNVIQLTKRHTNFLSSNGVKYLSKTNSGEGLYDNVTILFRGIGANTVIKLQGFTTIVPSNDIIIGKAKEA